MMIGYCCARLFLVHKFFIVEANSHLRDVFGRVFSVKGVMTIFLWALLWNQKCSKTQVSTIYFLVSKSIPQQTWRPREEDFSGP